MSRTKSTICLLVALALFAGRVRVHAHPIDPKAAVATEFIILHNNDMHARFEQTSVDSGTCSAEEANTKRCYGGFARVAHEVRQFRDEASKGGTPVVYLNAGDTYTGTPWFTVFKDNITAAFLNKLQPDAISLGNHEFDEKVEGLVPFLNEVNFPVLACNLDLSKVPELASAKNFAHSTTLLVNGVKVGVIGYLTPDTKFLVQPNDVEFKPEIESINAEAAKMKADGVNIIIALGHSGYQKDQQIAAECPEVDVVIGGHSHTLLYTGDQPDADRVEGPYPTTVKQASGKEVPVVQAYAYTKYLGKLHVQFDKDGNLVAFDGTPILLNASVPRDSDLLELLEVYRPNITDLENSIVGYTKVYLEGRSQVCRSVECNLGNLVTDAMVYARVLEDQGGAYWTDAAVAFLMGGGIRSSIAKNSDGSITETDVLTVLPFKNDIYMTKISGQTLHNALELSATIRTHDSNGGFLQMAGVHVTYDYNNAEGARVVSAEVRCAECEVPTYEPLDLAKMYNVLVPDYLLNGGDNHVFVEPNGAEPVRLQKNDQDTFIQFLKARGFVYPEVEGRITIVEVDGDGDGDGGDSATALASSILTLVAAALALRLLH